MGEPDPVFEVRLRSADAKSGAASQHTLSASLLPENMGLIIPQLANLHHRLLLVVGPHGSGKTCLLRACEQGVSGTYLNLSLVLSQRLLEFKAQDRPMQALSTLNDLLAGAGLLFVDNIELLFEPTLQLDPLRALKLASRRRSLVAAWPGTLDNGYLLYAVPGHPEHRRYGPRDLEDILVLNMTTLPAEV